MFRNSYHHQQTGAPRHLYGVPPRPQAHTQAPLRRSDSGEAWQRVARSIVHLIDPRVCPVALPLRAEPGLTTLRSGRPAKKFTADGFVVAGKALACFVVPDDRTGLPIIVWADGAPISRFKLMGI